jgi:hypothetical protein
MIAIVGHNAQKWSAFTPSLRKVSGNSISFTRGAFILARIKQVVLC